MKITSLVLLACNLSPLEVCQIMSHKFLSFLWLSVENFLFLLIRNLYFNWKMVSENAIFIDLLSSFCRRYCKCLWFTKKASSVFPSFFIKWVFLAKTDFIVFIWILFPNFIQTLTTGISNVMLYEFGCLVPSAIFPSKQSHFDGIFSVPLILTSLSLAKLPIAYSFFVNPKFVWKINISH